jgi:hypothetical protein
MPLCPFAVFILSQNEYLVQTGYSPGEVTMAYDKDKFDRLQILLPKEYTPRLDKIRGVIKVSPYVATLIIKHIEEEEKKEK